MKIVVFDNLNDGGAKTTVSYHLEGLSRSHEVIYVAHNEPSRMRVPDNIKVYKFDLGWRQFSGVFRLFQEMDMLIGLRLRMRLVAQFINGLEPDVVLVHPCRFTQSPFLLRYLRSPSVYFMQEWLRIVYEPDLQPLEEIILKKRWYEAWRRTVLGKIDMTNTLAATEWLATSTYMKKSIGWQYGIKPKLVYLGVDTDYFVPTDEEKKHFLFIGGEDRMSGYDLINQLRQRNDFKIECVIRNKRYISAENLRHLYQQAYAVLALARSEPFGLVPLEGMACGVPVIALDEGGHRDTVVNNKTGYLVADRVDEIAEMMKKMIDDQALRTKLGNEARKNVEQHFTWPLHTHRIEEVLNTYV